MILIAGGTGRLGSLVANQLCERGLNVRVLSCGLKHDPGTLRDGIEVVEGDVRDTASLPAAMDGVDAVLSAMQGFLGPDGVTPRRSTGWATSTSSRRQRLPAPTS